MCLRRLRRLRRLCLPRIPCWRPLAEASQSGRGGPIGWERGSSRLPRPRAGQGGQVISIHPVRHCRAPNLALVGVVRHPAPLVLHHIVHRGLKPLIVVQGLSIRRLDFVLVLLRSVYEIRKLLEGGALAHES
jgi:hypothetical protein